MKSLTELAAEIVQAQASNRVMSADEIKKLFNSIYKMLEESALNEKLPNDNLKKMPEYSIQEDKIICLECNKEFKLLTKAHLKLHNLTAREYKQKYGFKLNQPLCSKELSQVRKDSGKERGIPDELVKSRKYKIKKK